VVFANPMARERLGLRDGEAVALQSGPAFKTLRVAGSVATSGAPMLVMDLAGAQQHLGLMGKLTRIDLRLAPGTDTAPLLARLALPADVGPVAADEAEQRVSNLSRAYRVNLTVLALVALFVGAFLVFSVVSLSVAQRTPAFALLGVLGLTARQRRGWVLIECTLLGAAGSLLGLAGGAALAAAALRFLAGDLGGGYFPGIAPPLQWTLASALAFAAGHRIGRGGRLVAGAAGRGHRTGMALKGLGSPVALAPAGLAGPGACCCWAWPRPLRRRLPACPWPPTPAVALLLFGGVALVPAVVHACWPPRRPCAARLPLLALQRARFQRRTATAAVAGVVASLALSVALTVMVASFRSGVINWLTTALPADLYARSSPAMRQRPTRPGCHRALPTAPLRFPACSGCRRCAPCR
jgi:putative ABC transport system permease protein